MARINGIVIAVCAMVFLSKTSMAAPLAMWTDFTGADVAEGLAPQLSSTQNNIDGSAWRFRLAGDATVVGGSLLTGNGVAPMIVFDKAYDVGRASDGGTPMTVLMAVRAPLENVVDKPLVHLGNGATGVGMALAALDASAGSATLRGSWGNAAWGNPRATVNALAAKGVVFVALSTCTDTSNPTAIGTFDPETKAMAWTSLSGLTGRGINVTAAYFGNYAGQDSGGLGMQLFGVAVFAGCPRDEEIATAVAEMPTVAFGEVSGNDAWLFEDVEGVDHRVVTVTAAASPSTFTVNNAETSYIIEGEAIGGTVGLQKQGKGALFLEGANTFSGGVTIEGGTVVESGVSAFQSALGTGKNGSWANRLTLRNGTFDLNGTENYRNSSQAGAAYLGMAQRADAHPRRSGRRHDGHP